MQKMKLTSLVGQQATIWQFISSWLRWLFHCAIGNLLNMTKLFSIGLNRYVSVKKQDGVLNITICELGSDVKSLTFPARRWVQLTSLVEQVDESINRLLVKQNVDLKLAIGGKFYVSVTTGFICVDLREFYYHPTKGVSPTKRGIALRLNEWVTLKEVMQKLYVKYPILASTTPCTYEPNHHQEICLECQPFQFDELFFSTTT
jgi:Transcriptional Coactivator p15 (PC4)